MCVCVSVSVSVSHCDNSSAGTSAVPERVLRWGSVTEVGIQAGRQRPGLLRPTPGATAHPGPPPLKVAGSWS